MTWQYTCPCSSVVTLRTRALCAVERDVPQKPGSKLGLGLGMSAFHQRIISYNSYAHDEQGDNAELVKEGSTVCFIICDRCWHLE